MPLPPDAGPVLPWGVHDRKHEAHPITGRKLYVLDLISDEPEDVDLLYCGFCGRFVHRRDTGVPRG